MRAVWLGEIYMGPGFDLEHVDELRRARERKERRQSLHRMALLAICALLVLMVATLCSLRLGELAAERVETFRAMERERQTSPLFPAGNHHSGVEVQPATIPRPRCDGNLVFTKPPFHCTD